MKKITALTVAALMIGGLGLTSCKKYEDGPALSLLTKKMRVAGTWEVEAFFVDGVDKTSDYRAFTTSETIEYKKDGSYTSSYTYVIGSDTDAGTWEFINDKEEIKTLSNDAGATPDTMVILKLKNKEMWFTEKTPGSTVESIHLKAK